MAALTIILIVILTSEIKVHADTNPGAALPVGGLFNDNTAKSSLKAFDNIGVPKESGTRKSYYGRIIYPDVIDSYSTALEVCQNTSSDAQGEHGVVALIDARATNGLCDTTCLLSNRLNITHLTLGWEPTDTMAEDLFTFAYHPSPAVISKAFARLIRELDWDRFTIFYEDDGSFVRLQEIINSWPLKNEPITFRRLVPGGNNGETFKEVLKVSRLSHHIIDCEVDNLVGYMTEISVVENSTMYQSFILTNLNSHTVNLSEVSMSANVSTMNLIVSSSSLWTDPNMEMESLVQVETALTVDALRHLGQAIDVMQKNEEEALGGTEAFASQQLYGSIPAICLKASGSEYEPWPWGDKLRQAMIDVSTWGATGNIEFSETGERTNFQLHYLKLNTESEFMYAGYWESKTDLIKFEGSVPDRSASQKSGEITVVSKKGKPYFIVEAVENVTTIRGYAVDLAKKIFEKINKNGTQFNLKFKEADEDIYGNPIEGTKRWSGIIGELLEHKADLAICDLTITSDRNAVVDFSTPFMSTGISMLLKEREPEKPDMFSFINPLSLDVWLYLATTYIIVSFVLLICARMSQDDWVNPHPCNQNPESLQNIWSLYNCMWLTMGTIMTQGCDILPRGIGSRWIAGMWWFFAMIVTASYTANMSTFLSNSRRTNDIKDVKQLSEQTEVRYGAVTNASTYRFFENSDDPVYQKIWQVMKTARPTVFMKTNDEGKDRVLKSKGNYVFFMESTAIKYYTERNCMLTTAGGQLDSKQYGIAMPKNFPYKSAVDRAILQLQESGELNELYKKWWEQEDKVEEEACNKNEDEEDDGSLKMKNTSGIFLVLGVGGILGFITAIVDFMMHARKIAVKEKVTWKEALASEWRASLNPRALSKPAAPPRSAPPSSGSSSPERDRSRSRAASVLKAATSFINFDEIY